MIQCIDCDTALEQILAERTSRDKRERIAQNLLVSGLPKPYRNGTRTWETVKAEVGANAAAVAILKNGKGLYLWGKSGPDKTSFAASYLAEAIKSGKEGRYVFMLDMFTELYSVYASSDTRSRADVVDRYALTPCLVLDDLGKESPNPHAAAVLLEILDFRYREDLRWMIVTSNYPQQELSSRLASGAGSEFSEPIMRRLSEMTVGVPMGAA